MASPAPVNGASAASPSAAAATPQPTAAALPPSTLKDAAIAAPSQSYTAPAAAPTSATDSGSSLRPRDARTIHMVLASLGVQSYQERVPLQLLDFAYRYTSSVLSDAHHLQAEGYLDVSTSNTSGKTSNKRAANAAAAGPSAAEKDELGLNAVRAATASRLGYQFTSSLPKETLLEIAAERNRMRLPDAGAADEVGARGFGVRLPHERFILSGADWELLEEWDGEEDSEDEEDVPLAAAAAAAKPDADVRMGGPGVEDEDEDEDDVDKEDFDAVFGGNDEDKEMEEG